MEARLVGGAAGDGGSARAGGSTRQLAHLENLLQALARHETRATSESVERTSAVTQQRLLKDQLLRAQEELAAAQASKASLCEEVGALQQASARQCIEIAQFKAQVAAAHEAQDALVRKVAEMEDASRSMKREYIRSLDCRMKTAAQLLSKIQLGSGSASGQEVDVARELSEKSAEWAEPDVNKRKRRHSETDNEHKTEDSTMEAIKASQSDAEAAKDTVTTTDIPLACRECDRAKTEHHKEITEMQATLADLQKAHSALQGEHQELVEANIHARTARETEASIVQSRDAEIELLKKQLAVVTEKAGSEDAMRDAAGTGQAVLDLESQVKLLEDNLNQMNSYADQLELVISQCPSCTIKLQSESTQDSVVKNA